MQSISMIFQRGYRVIILLMLLLGASHDLMGNGFIADYKAIATSNKQENKLCLTMIVKDETSYLEESLKSVRDIIDCICICDVGSSNETRQIIEKFMSETGIPGEIHKHEWQNFGHNRTLSVKAAKQTIVDLGLPLSQTYLFIMDADMILHLKPAFRKDTLKADLYLVMENKTSLSYHIFNAHLLRASIPWESVGVAHEYWTYQGPYQSEKLHSLAIEEKGDKPQKLKTNVELLNKGLSQEPDNGRYHFYSGQTQKSLKHYDDAITSYLTCIQKGGSREEIWFSKYMLGELYEEMGMWDKALYWYLESYQYNPNLAEPLRKIATYYRFRGQNDLSVMFAKHGRRIPHSDDQILFSSSPLQDFQFDEELSIAAYYTRFKDDGFTASNDIILRKEVPGHLKGQTYRNLLFYVQNLKNAQYKPISIKLPRIVDGIDEQYHPMNPSIQKTDNGYKVICRSVNYTQVGAKWFNTIDLNGVFRTKNFLVQYDRDFNLLSQQEIVENLDRPRIYYAKLEGLEDCRLVEFNNSSWFTCTSVDTSFIGQREISLCKLADHGNETINVEKLLPLKGPDPNRCEKNWLPFAKDDQLYVVYSYDPFVIYKPNIETGDCKLVYQYEPSHDFSQFRGSAGPIKFDNGYLILVHEVTLTYDYSRCYLHRFIYLDQNFVVQKTSRPFTFQHQGVEYCCGMIDDHSGTKLVMAVGIEDREAYLCFVDLDTIRSLLNPLPNF